MTWLPVVAVVGFFLLFGAAVVGRRTAGLTHWPRARRLGYAARVVGLHGAVGLLAASGALLHAAVGTPGTLAVAAALPAPLVGAVVVTEFELGAGRMGARTGVDAVERFARRHSFPLAVVAVAVAATLPFAVGLVADVRALVVAWPLVGLVAGLRARPFEADATPIREGDPPADATNVVVCMVDSLRRDRTSLHGYDRATTPFLERTRGEAVVFENCIAPGTRSGHSIPSLLTGAPASRHGYGSNVADMTVLSEAFADAGYATVAVSGNPHVTGDRFGDRFDWFVRLRRGKDYLFGVQRLARRSLVALGRRHLPSHYFFLDIEFVHELARGFLGDAIDDDRPFFAYFSYMDIHDPYVREFPPVREFAAEHGAALERGAWMADREGDMTEWYDADVKGWGYDETVRYTDRHIAALFDWLEARGVREDTAVVVTADHGELLGEGGYWGHIDVPVGPLVEVPLVVYPPTAGGDADLAGETVDRVVSGADLPSLCCARAGIDPPAARREQWLRAPTLAGLCDAGPGGTALVDNEASAVWTKAYEHPLTGRVEHNDTPPETSVRRQRLLVGPDWKCLHLNDEFRFYRRGDAMLDEATDAVPDDVARALRAELSDLDAALDDGPEADPYGDLDDESVRGQLEDLGYL